MTETGNSGIRTLLQKSFIRIPLKLALWLIVFAAITFVGALAYNALKTKGARLKLFQKVLLMKNHKIIRICPLYRFYRFQRRFS